MSSSSLILRRTGQCIGIANAALEVAGPVILGTMSAYTNWKEPTDYHKTLQGLGIYSIMTGIFEAIKTILHQKSYKLGSLVLILIIPTAVLLFIPESATSIGIVLMIAALGKLLSMASQKQKLEQASHFIGNHLEMIAFFLLTLNSFDSFTTLFIARSIPALPLAYSRITELGSELRISESKPLLANAMELKIQAEDVTPRMRT